MLIRTNTHTQNVSLTYNIINTVYSIEITTAYKFTGRSQMKGSPIRPKGVVTDARSLLFVHIDLTFNTSSDSDHHHASPHAARHIYAARNGPLPDSLYRQSSQCFTNSDNHFRGDSVGTKWERHACRGRYLSTKADDTAHKRHLIRTAGIGDKNCSVSD